jgi:hypothetical protein
MVTKVTSFSVVAGDTGRRQMGLSLRAFSDLIALSF